MSATLIRTCPLCGLRFDNLPILELHIREDHRGAETPARRRTDGDPAARPKTADRPVEGLRLSRASARDAAPGGGAG